MDFLSQSAYITLTRPLFVFNLPQSLDDETRQQDLLRSSCQGILLSPPRGLTSSNCRLSLMGASDLGYGTAIGVRHPNFIVGSVEPYENNNLFTALSRAFANTITPSSIEECLVLYCHGIAYICIRICLYVERFDTNVLRHGFKGACDLLCQYADSNSFYLFHNWHCLARAVRRTAPRCDISTPTLSWTYSINYIFALGRATRSSISFSKDGLSSAASAYCGPYATSSVSEGMSGVQDSENVHGIRYINHGFVGSVVLLEEDNNFFHLQRAISMLSTLSTMIGSLNYLNEELYRRLHQDYDTSSGASLDRLRKDMNEFRRYARVIIYESLPDSICTDSFDASMYTKAWDTWDGYVIVENVEKHIQSISELIEYVQSRLYEQADKRTQAILLILAAAGAFGMLRDLMMALEKMVNVPVWLVHGREISITVAIVLCAILAVWWTRKR